MGSKEARDNKMDEVLDQIAEKTVELAEIYAEERLHEYCAWIADQELVECNTNYVDDFLRATRQ